MPSSMRADEPCVESVDPGRGDNLRSAALRVGADDVHDECGFEHGEVGGDRGPAHLAGAGQGRRLENLSTLRHEQLQEPLERVSPLEPEELEHILRPVRLGPFLKIAFRQAVGQEERREAAVQEPAIEVPAVECLEIGVHHRREPDFTFSARERVAKSGGCAKRGRARGEHLRRREVVGGEL